ncbi:hypothetical protein ACFQ60_12710 [Streptomyces zhihengii]
MARPAVAVAAALVAGVSGVAAVGGAVRAAVPPGWGVLGYLLCGTALLLVLRTELPAGVRRGLAVAAGTVQAVSALSAVPLVLLSLVGPASWPAGVWGLPPAREALPVEWPLSSLWATPVVLAVLAATAAVAAFRPGALPCRWPGPRRPAGCGGRRSVSRRGSPGRPCWWCRPWPTSPGRSPWPGSSSRRSGCWRGRRTGRPRPRRCRWWPWCTA